MKFIQSKIDSAILGEGNGLIGKVLVCQCEDLSSNLRSKRKKLSLVVNVCKCQHFNSTVRWE